MLLTSNDSKVVRSLMQFLRSAIVSNRTWNQVCAGIVAESAKVLYKHRKLLQNGLASHDDQFEASP